MGTNVCIALVVAALALNAQDKKPPSQKEIGAELDRLERADQADQDNDQLDPAEFSRRQKVRRDRAMEIVKAGLLETPADFNNAAWLFQHGTEVDDFLLSHALATAAGFDASTAHARFLSAAALDRFLQNIQEPQRFGTQFGEDGAPEEPFEPSVGPALRRIFSVDEPKGAKAKAALEGAKPPSVKELPQWLKLVKSEKRDEVIAHALAFTRAGEIDKGKDCLVLARVLGASDRPEHLLHAHIAVIAAAFRGEEAARAGCAESLDRWLLSINRPQRFGTVLDDANKPREPWDRSWHDVVRVAYGLEPLDPANKKLKKK